MIRLWRAARALSTRPGWSSSVVLTLGLGFFGVVTAFGLLDALLFRPLPVRDEDRLVSIYQGRGSGGEGGDAFGGFMPLSYANFEDLHEGAPSLEGAFAYSLWPVSAGAAGTAERVDAIYVSSTFFSVLGVGASRGRVFREGEGVEPGADPVVVLQHDFWESRFGGDPGVVGSTLQVNGRALEIIGVAARDFRGPVSTYRADLFIPVSMLGDVKPWGPLWEDRPIRLFFAGGRLAAGRDVASVRAELEEAAARLRVDFPDVNREFDVRVVPLSESRAGAGQQGTLDQNGRLVLGAAVLLLLVAGLNVSSLLLARALAQRRELAVRVSLGATRWDLFRESLAEAALLFVVGGVLGGGASMLVLRALDGYAPPAFVAGTLDLQFGWRVLAVAGTSAVLALALFATGPGLRASRSASPTSLREALPGRRGEGVAGIALVSVQACLAAVGLSVAAVFMSNLGTLSSVDPGFTPDRLGVMSIDPALLGYDEVESRELYERVLGSLRDLPAVQNAALGSLRPLTPGPLQRVGPAEGDEDDLGTLLRVERVSAGFFQTLGIPVEEGRGVTELDRRDAVPVAVVNRRAQRLLWGDGEVLGRRLSLSLYPDPIEVVGVVPSVPTLSFLDPPEPVVYLPAAQHHPVAANLFFRLRPGGSMDEVRAAVRTVDPQLPVYDIDTGRGLVADVLWRASTTTHLVLGSSVVGLFLLAVGTHGVLMRSVRRRGREMGIRLALGAGRGRVVGEAVGRVLIMVALGALVGVGVGRGVVLRLSPSLFGIGILDAWVFPVVGVALLAFAALSAYLPARRIVRADPAATLRE